MAVDMNEILLGEQAACLAAAARAHAQQMDFQEKLFAIQGTSVDLVEAAAAKELSKSGIATDMAGFNSAAQTPKA